MKNFILLPLLSCFCFTHFFLTAEEHVVELFNAQGEKTVYRHHQNGTLYAIENYEENGNLLSRETFFWEKNDSSSARIQASFTENDIGDILNHNTFNYSPNGDLEAIICSDYEKGDIQNSTLYNYSHEGCLQNDPTNSTEEITPSSNSSAWNKIVDAANWCSTNLTDLCNYLNSIKENLSYSNYITPQVEPTLEDVFSKGFLQFAGYYRQEHTSGTFIGDKPEADSKVRITMINGILSLNKDLQESLIDISNSHDQKNIHYVFRATDGWTKDILNGTLIKWGYTSDQARMLAKMWIDLIDELGGINGGGTIIHYAHSIGALDTYCAQFLLSPEQRRMIHVVTIGSPTMIPNEGFASVVNYASRRDGVCLLDPLRFIGGLLVEDPSIIYLDTFWGAPLIDHPLSVESYQKLIKELGEKFIETYGIPVPIS